ncbi:TetR/AcrR family transcriptional regulator [Actinomadura sp. 6N118]|uniref:TetR/AcrR family transcriptional regulator n=1 Tax=Actinomadura sp. 6N118 TaxID=3375151 RepID=UPI00378C0FD8
MFPARSATSTQFEFSALVLRRDLRHSVIGRSPSFFRSQSARGRVWQRCRPCGRTLWRGTARPEGPGSNGLGWGHPCTPDTPPPPSTTPTPNPALASSFPSAGRAPELHGRGVPARSRAGSGSGGMSGMRTHGWRGNPPATDAEARAWIIDATRRCVERYGPRKTGLTDVAEDLGVTRATIYRYFRNIDDMLKASSLAAAGEFLDRMRAHMEGIEDAREILVEVVAYTVEQLPREPHVGALIAAGRSATLAADLLSPLTRSFTKDMLLGFAIDWPAWGYEDEDLDGLAEFLLRLLHSYLRETTSEANSETDDVRPFLRRWLVPGFLAQPAGPPLDART